MRAHSKPVWSVLCPRACKQGCVRLLPSHFSFPPTQENPGKCLPTKKAASEQRTRPSKGYKATSWSVMWGQLPPTRRGNVGQGAHRGTTPASLFKTASLSKLNVYPNQVKRAKHSEMVLIIHRLQNKAVCPEAFSFQQIWDPIEILQAPTDLSKLNSKVFTQTFSSSYADED